MNEYGLAAAAAQPTPDGSQDIGKGRQLIDEVKAMLIKGAAPEELLRQGIPEDILMQAIQELEQEIQAQQEPDSQGHKIQGQPVGDADQKRQLIDKVKDLLANGATPEDLLNQGIPKDILMQAIQELKQEMGSQQPEMQEQPMTQPGLAAQGAM